MEADQVDNNEMEPFKAKLSRALGGFSKEVPKGKYRTSTYKLDRNEFPVPELILFTLRNILGWEWRGQGEKTRWSVYGSVEGEFIQLEHTKFGLRFTRSHATELRDLRVLRQLAAGVKIVEKVLRPHAKHLIDLGEFSMVNRYSEFMDRYKFFREKAEVSFKAADNPPEIGNGSELEGVLASLRGVFNYQHEHFTSGFYNSVAMIDCYFSGLEHRLLLMRAFSGEPLGTEGFRGFMEMSWEQKIGLFIDITKDKRNRDLLAQLKAVKDRIRNPFAHGGFENDKGAMFVNFPLLGSIPANFTDFGKSSRFSLMPVESDNFSEICGAFDQLDQALSSNNLWGVHRIIEAGVDPSFDERRLKLYYRAIHGDEGDVDALIDQWGHEYAIHANMDY
ncbi:hypothetical protein D3C76_258040 [compost metagenome]